MHIRHERPEAGLNFLVTAPLLFWPDAADGPSPISSWSMEGVVFADGAGPHGPGHLRLPFQGVCMDLPIYLGTPDEKGFAPFVEMTVRQREVLTVLYQGLLSGQMTSTQDMIQSLDTPVDKVPMSETQEEQEVATASVTPRLLRMARTMAVYGLVAALLIGGMGGKIWQRLDQLAPADARVAAPMVAHYFGEAGQVKDIAVVPGQEVQAGDLLVALRNSDLDRQADAVRAQIRLIDQRRDQALQAFQAHDVLVRAERDPLVDAYLFAHRGTGGDFKHPVLQSTYQALKDYDAGIGSTSGDARTVADLLRGRLDELDTDLKFARRELGDLKGKGEAANLRAQVDGVVREIHVPDGVGVRAQALGLTIEEDAPRTIIGFLSDRHADQVYVGMPAKVSLRVGPSRKTLPAKVVDFRLVARGTAGQASAAQSYGLQVEVAVEGLTHAECMAMLRPDAPVRLQLFRETRQRLVATFLSWIGL